MAEINPFRAIHYDFQKHPDLSNHLAPPYDVLDATDKARLLEKSNRNIVDIDLPHLPPKSAGPPEAYENARKKLDNWLADGTLVRETDPALYLYHQVFDHAGQSYTRKMFIARTRLVPFEEGSVVPHEETFGGPKEDRLALMKATACNLSPIFGLFPDPDGVVDAAFHPIAAQDPAATATMDGVENRAWIVRDPHAVDTVVRAMLGFKIYIADGHHRYGTALMYREFVREQLAGDLPEHHPANFVMFVLASMDDPGCLILPYNRALAGISLDDTLAAWADAVSPCDDREADLVLVEGKSDRSQPVRFTQRQRLDELERDKSAAFKALDAAYLHRVLIDDLLHARRGTDKPAVRYVKSEAAARQAAREEDGVALLVNATPIAHLRAVGEAGELMPQKSTYFHPKLATGITINSLADA